VADTVTCSHCKREFSGMMWRCPFCGSGRTREAVHDTPVCPTCALDLVSYRYRDEVLDACPSCKGFWLDRREFRKLTSKRDVYRDDAIPDEFVRGPVQNIEGYRPCPVCNVLMSRKNFKSISGVMIDECRDHGVWLDAGELEQVRTFVANGGIDELFERDLVLTKEQVNSVETRVRNLEFMEKIIHPFNLRRLIFRNI
jgi:Zn-finger nucleic acid-binding protein